jgi:hypothetical protein
MARFFLRPTWPLIFTSTLIVLLTVFGCLYALLYVDDIFKERNYSIELSRYESWLASNEGGLCSEILKSCEKEAYRIYPLEKNKSFYDQLTEYDDWEKYKERCQIKYSNWSDRCLTNPPQKPEPHTIIEILGSALLLYPFLIPVMFFSIRRLYGIQHLGWQRITVVASTGFGLLFLFVFYSEFNRENILYLPLICLPLVLLGFMIPSAGVYLYKWIGEGFQKNTSEASSNAVEVTTVSGSDDVKISLNWESVKPIIKAVAIFLAVIMALLFKPEIVVKGAVSGGIMVAVVVVFYAIRKAKK